MLLTPVLPRGGRQQQAHQLYEFSHIIFILDFKIVFENFWIFSSYPLPQDAERLKIAMIFVHPLSPVKPIAYWSRRSIAWITMVVIEKPLQSG